MFLKKVAARSAAQLFTIVRNNSALSMTPGRGVMYDYSTNPTTTAFAGFGVTYADPLFATQGVHPAHFAGIVVGREIPPGRFGSIQIWGYCESIVVGHNTDGTNPLYQSTTNIPIYSDLDIINAALFLRPLGMSVTDNMTGALGFFQLRFTADQEWGPCPPYVIPVDAVIPDGSTTYGTITHNSTGTVRGFIRCL